MLRGTFRRAIAESRSAGRKVIAHRFSGGYALLLGDECRRHGTKPILSAYNLCRPYGAQVVIWMLSQR